MRKQIILIFLITMFLSVTIDNQTPIISNALLENETELSITNEDYSVSFVTPSRGSTFDDKILKVKISYNFGSLLQPYNLNGEFRLFKAENSSDSQEDPYIDNKELIHIAYIDYYDLKVSGYIEEDIDGRGIQLSSWFTLSAELSFSSAANTVYELTYFEWDYPSAGISLDPISLITGLFLTSLIATYVLKRRK